MSIAYDPALEYRYAVGERPGAAARWTSRLAVFAAMLLIAALFMHRFLSLPTPVAYNLGLVALAAAATACLLALYAGLDIWFTGRNGAARAIFGGVVGAALLSLPLAAWVVARDIPHLHDISTDTKSPPAFTELARQRAANANSPKYPTDGSAEVQRAAHPDLKTQTIERPADDVFELAVDALKRLKMTVVRVTPPDLQRGTPGLVEATDQTLVFGFTDDVVMRVAGTEAKSNLDVRSAARFGSHDFGRNAERVRAILREFDGRLAANPYTPAPLKASEPVLKPVKERSPPKRLRRKRPPPALLGIPRALEPIE